MASQTLGESTESLALSLRQPEVARLIIIDIYNINRLAELLVYPLQDTLGT